MSNFRRKEGTVLRTPEQAMATVGASLRKRYRAEQRFRAYGLISVILGLSFLAILLASIVGNGYSAFRQTFVTLDIHFDADVIDPEGTRDPETLRLANYSSLSISKNTRVKSQSRPSR